MSTLYLLAALFLAIWIAGVLIHIASFVIGTVFHYALWIAIILFVVGYAKGRTSR